MVRVRQIDRHDLPRPDLPEDTGQLRTAHLAASGTSVITADPWMTA